MDLIKNNNLSYWELKHYFCYYDLIVIGAGIVGLNAAISFKKAEKRAKVLVLERGVFPEGASTKNAGFACFGSAGELLDDLEKGSEQLVSDTVKLRWNGLQLLRKRLGDASIEFKGYGGYELFSDKNQYLTCVEKLPYLNDLLEISTGKKTCFKVQKKVLSSFSRIQGGIFNAHEGQIDPGLMMKNLSLLAMKTGVEILYNIQVDKINDLKHGVDLVCKMGVFKARKVIVATNGFAQQLLNLRDVKPARAQVLITKPISSLSIRGTFHMEQGFYYFRNIDNRILLGGGRNLDFKTEETTEPDLNRQIQAKLDELLQSTILPGRKIAVDLRWTGIMGVGKEKKPIIKKVGNNCIAAVRMGGMGIAIGSLVGDLASKKLLK